MKTASAIYSSSSESKLESTSNLPYSKVKIKLSESSKQMIQNAIHPSEVAKAILEAFTSDNPDFRYVVGQDASKIIGARKYSLNVGGFVSSDFLSIKKVIGGSIFIWLIICANPQSLHCFHSLHLIILHWIGSCMQTQIIFDEYIFVFNRYSCDGMS